MRRSALSLVLALVASLLSSTAVLAADGAPKQQQHGSITITSNEHFDAEHGVRSGKGTANDPYVISGWNVHHLEIKDTSKHVIIRDNVIPGTLILDWIGDGVHVYDNDIGDLRVNRNVKRTGEMTSGVIMNNRFGVVGQLRHWDGVFAHNVVGHEDSCMDLPFYDCRAVNFDGFNGAHFRDNEIFGYVEVRLHGHHHSSNFEKGSHYHGAEHEDMVDHTKRFHQVRVSRNTIHSGDYYGLLYTDSAHSANDRTAASETNPKLNDPHVHTTKVRLNNNRILGAGIHVNIFNADDQRHLGTKTGSMEIKGNRISVQQSELDADEVLFSNSDGIYVYRATDLKLSIAGNKIDGTFQENADAVAVREQFDSGAGISLWDIDMARVRIMNNRVVDRTYGVRASSMSRTVKWWVGGLKTKNVQQDVYYDSSVQNEPRRKR